MANQFNAQRSTPNSQGAFAFAPAHLDVGCWTLGVAPAGRPSALSPSLLPQLPAAPVRTAFLRIARMTPRALRGRRSVRGVDSSSDTTLAPVPPRESSEIVRWRP